MTHKMGDLDRVISTLEGLTRAELVRLRTVIDTYLAEGCLEFEIAGRSGIQIHHARGKTVRPLPLSSDMGEWQTDQPL